MLNLAKTPDPYNSRAVHSMDEIAVRSASASGRASNGQFTHAFLSGMTGDDFPADSKFWRRQANASMRYLGALLGAQYPEWAELTWPGSTIDNLTWRTLRDMTEAAIVAYEKQAVTNISKLADAAHFRLTQLLKESNLL